MATFHAELTRKGPGILLRDLERGKDKQITALKQLVEAVDPNVLLLTKVDFDLERRTARALGAVLGYEYTFTHAPNSMIPTAVDLDGDGRTGDRQTWARYAGEGGMLLLSKHPIKLKFHLNDLLWEDVEGAKMPLDRDSNAYPSTQARTLQKLVSQGLWVVEIQAEDTKPVTLALFQNQTPVFDGPEDLNGLRNRAQLVLLSAVMKGTYGDFPKERFVLMGNANLDPNKGEGDRSAIADLLEDKRVQDVKPESELGGIATAFWEKAGAHRVSYILPSAEWLVGQANVVWPETGPLRTAVEKASRNRMIWMDITQP